MQQIKPLLIPTNGRSKESRHTETRYISHEVAALRAVGPSGRTKSLANQKGSSCA
jgi:hypothetical protein